MFFKRGLLSLYTLSVIGVSIFLMLLLMKMLSLSPSDILGIDSDDDSATTDDYLPSEEGGVHFYPMRPNFEIVLPLDGKLRRLKIHVDLMTRGGTEALLQFQKYDPLIRGELLSLFSQISAERLLNSSMSFQAQLREQAFQSIRDLLKKQTHEDYLEQLVFTSFSLQ